jgi:hypothetical protein
MLAFYGERLQPPVRELPDAQTRALRELWVRREHLIEMLVMEENRLERARKALHRSLRSRQNFVFEPVVDERSRRAQRLLSASRPADS